MKEWMTHRTSNPRRLRLAAVPELFHERLRECISAPDAYPQVADEPVGTRRGACSATSGKTIYLSLRGVSPRHAPVALPRCSMNSLKRLVAVFT